MGLARRHAGRNGTVNGFGIRTADRSDPATATCPLLGEFIDAAERHGGNAAVLVGSVGAGLSGALLVRHDGETGYLDRVKSWHPGLAHGRALLAAAEAWLAERGVRAVICEQAPDRELFISAGYMAGDGSMSRVVAGTEGVRVPITITDLEMRQRPSEPVGPAPHGHKVSIHRAERPGVDFYRFLYNTVGASWYWVDRRLMSDEDLAAAVTGAGVELYVLQVAGVPAGYGELARTGEDVDLAYFGLMPGYIGRGIGWYFIRAIVDIAWSADPERLTVNTCDLDHPRALRTYQRAGFSVVGRRGSSIADPRTVGLPWPRSRRA